MSLFYAQHFQDSFVRAVVEAGAEQPRSIHAPLALRKSRRLARRPRSRSAASSSSASKEVEMIDSSVPPPSSSAFKRIRLSPPLPHDAKCSTTMLWRASAFDSIVESQRERVLSFFRANTTTVRFSCGASSFSVVVRNDVATMRQVREIASRIGSLGVVGATTPTPFSSTKKRSLERLLEDE